MRPSSLSLTFVFAASCVRPMGGSAPGAQRPSVASANRDSGIERSARDAAARDATDEGALRDPYAQSFERSLDEWVREASRRTERAVSVQRVGALRELAWERDLCVSDVVLRDDLSGLLIPVRVWATRPAVPVLPWVRRPYNERAIEEAIAIHTVEAWLEAHADVVSVVRYRLRGESVLWGISTAQQTTACVSDSAPHGATIEACWPERMVFYPDVDSFERVSQPREMLVGRLLFLGLAAGARVRVAPSSEVWRSHRWRANRDEGFTPVERVERPALGPIEFLWARFEHRSNPVIEFSTETLVTRCERDGRWRCERPRSITR